MRLAHIRGWLAVFVAYCILWVGVSAYNVSQMMRAVSEIDQLRGRFGTLLLATVLDVVLILAFGFGILLILRRARVTRKYWLTVLSAKLPASLYTGFATFTVMAAVARQNGQPRPSLDDFQIGELRRMAVVVIWIAYWVRSRRVRDSFGNAATPAA